MTVDEVRWRALERSAEHLLELVGSLPYGRVVFTHRALPTVRVVGHAVVGSDVVIRSDEGELIVPPVVEPAGAVVAYEVDMIEPDWSGGWSVVVTGTASIVTDGAEQARYAAALPQRDGVRRDRLLVIRPEIVTGYELTTAPSQARPGRAER